MCMLTLTCTPPTDVHHVHAGLRVPRAGQCFPGAPARHQAPQEGQAEGPTHRAAEHTAAQQDHA